MPDIREFKPKDAAAKEAAVEHAAAALEDMKGADNVCAFCYDENGHLQLSVVNMSTSEIVLAVESIKLQVMLDQSE